MKITFVHADFNDLDPRWFTIWKTSIYTGNIHFGVAILSACLKQAGHTISLIHISMEYSREQFQEELKKHAPDLIALSCMSAMYPYMKKIAEWSKEIMDVPVVCGGPHPTLVPEETLGTDGIDIICRGEGEQALVELCDRLESDKDYSDIKNLWIKHNGTIIRNEMSPLIENLDELPDFDFELFNVDNLHSMLERNNAWVMASRGCPFKCTYCCNHRFRELYPNHHRYVRYRSPSRVIEELKRLRQAHPRIGRFRFWDDILTLNKQWSREFLPMYREEINLPFHCYGKIDVLDDERIQLMKDAGCERVSLGIQSGNSEIRKNILGRNMSNERILNTCRKINDAGLTIMTENILGLPGEDSWKILETVKINAQIDPANMWIFMFQPFNNTAIYELCKDRDLLLGEKEIIKLGINNWDGPNIKMPLVSGERVRFYQNYFQPIIDMYTFMYRRLIHALPLLDAFFTWKYLPLGTLNKIHARHFGPRLKFNFSRVRLPRKMKIPLFLLCLTVGSFILLYRKISKK